MKITNKFIIYEDTWPSLNYSWESREDIVRVDINKEFEKENKNGWEVVQMKWYTEDFHCGDQDKRVYEVLYQKKWLF